jgi:hypothetical protein
VAPIYFDPDLLVPTQRYYHFYSVCYANQDFYSDSFCHPDAYAYDAANQHAHMDAPPGFQYTLAN